MNNAIKHELEVPPVSVAQLALRLHMDGNQGLETDLPLAWNGAVEADFLTYEITDRRLIFRSLAARNELLAKYLFDQFFACEEIDAAALFSIAYTLLIRETDHEDFVSVRLLMAAQGHHDIFHLATKALEAGERCFDIFHVLDATLRYVTSISLENLFQFCRSQATATKGDMAAGRFYNIMENWLSRHPDTAREVLQKGCSAIDNNTVNLFSAALLALASNTPQEAVKLLLDSGTACDCFEPHHKLWISGRLLLLPQVPKAEKDRLHLYILDGITQKDDVIRLKAIGAATTALHLSDKFDQVLREIATTGEQTVLAEIGDALFSHSTELLEQNRFFIWLPLLTQLESEHSLDGLDYALSNVLEKSTDNEDLIIDFFTSWSTKNADNSPIDKKFAHIFDQCLLKICENPKFLAKIITKWLNHDDRKLAAAASGVLSDLELKRYSSVQFDLNVIETMSIQDLVFIGRRLLGFVHSTNHLLSLSFSMLNVAPAHLQRIIPLLQTLIVDEIGYDYPSTTLKALEDLTQTNLSQEILEAINHWKISLEEKIKETKELPQLNELKPSTNLQRQFAVARAKQMEKSREAAEEQSFFRQIATQIPLKAGNGCFNYQDGNFGSTNQLSSFSYSIELPRREVLDPVGYAIRGYHLRTAKKLAK